MLYSFLVFLQYDKVISRPREKEVPCHDYLHNVSGVGYKIQTIGGRGNKDEGSKKIRGGVWKPTTKRMMFDVS